MSSAVRSEDQFLCSICLQLFNNPVSTPCGHNFCRTCLTEHWDTSSPCRCPLCQKTFHLRPELCVNMLLSEMVLGFKQETESRSKQLSKPGDVPCDVCTDPKLKALKSCLVCLASYCETHFQPHMTVSGLKRHQLIDPVEKLEDMMCPEHDKVLELFCRTENSCICTICNLLEHKNHECVSLKEEFDRRKASLHETQAETQHMIEQRRLMIQEIQHSVDLSQKSVDRETATGLQIFTALMESVQRSQDQFIDRLQQKQKQTQKQAQDLIKELEQEISELENCSAEMERLSHSEDHLHFIQHTLPDLKVWKFSFEPEKLEGSAATALFELEQKLTKEIHVFKTRNLQGYAVDITLDSDTANACLVLSENLKEVYCHKFKKNLPYNPRRFTNYTCVLGKQSFSSGRSYFEVQVIGKMWILGVAQESIDRNETFTWCPENGLWAIGLCRENEYTAFDNPHVTLSLKRAPHKVGVFVDYGGSMVCFYDIDTKDHIYSFTGCCFREKLHPFLNPWSKNSGKISTLILTAVKK